jgi:hypothetical protein
LISIEILSVCIEWFLLLLKFLIHVWRSGGDRHRAPIDSRPSEIDLSLVIDFLPILAIGKVQSSHFCYAN